MDEEQINQLLKDLGFGDASAETRATVMGKINQMIDDEVLYTLVSGVADQDLDEINQKLAEMPGSEEEKSDAMITMLTAKVPNAEEAVSQALAALFERIKHDNTAINDYLASVNYQPPA